MYLVKRSILRNGLKCRWQQHQQQQQQICGLKFSATATSAAAAAATASVIQPPSITPLHQQFLNPLRDSKVDTEKVRSTLRNHRIATTSFQNLNPQLYRLPENEKGESDFFTSTKDDIHRHPFQRETDYLKGMLVSFSNEQFYEQSFRILKSLAKLVNAEELTQIANSSLQLIANESSVTFEKLEKIAKDMQKQCDFKPDQRTQAVFLGKLLAENKNPDKFLNKLDESKSIRSVLENSDVIGADNMYKVFDSEVINQSCVPQELVEVYKQYKLQKESGSVAEDTVKLQSKESIDMLKKRNVAELDAVDSFGMQVVRHSLLGLDPDPSAALLFAKEVEKIVEDLDEDVKSEINSGKLDYYEIYNKLETAEQKKQFNRALDEFNHDRQRQIEVRGMEGAREKWKHDFEEATKRGDLNMSKGLNAKCYEWFQELMPLIKREQDLCRDLINGDKSAKQGSTEDARERALYAPYLIQVPAERAAVITILDVLRQHAANTSNKGMRISQTMAGVGKSFEAESKVSKLAKKDAKLFASKKFAGSTQLQRVIRKSLEKQDDKGLVWDPLIRSKIGGVLLSFLMSSAKVKVTRDVDGKKESAIHPAFFHSVTVNSGSKSGMFNIHSEVRKVLSGNQFSDTIMPQSMPMLVEPKPWSSYYGGGSLYSEESLIRLKESPETSAYVKAAAKRGNLTEVFDGLNVLGSTPWTMNRKIFDVVSHYWNTGEEYLTIPPVSDQANLPARPETMDPRQIFEYDKAFNKAAREFASNRSRRCDYNYKLEIARAYLGEKLYFPCNLDFRGRAYPITPFLNHLGGDITRSLFLFWDGKELGKRGLEWLKVQLANVYGIDKAPLSERIQFVEERLEDAIKSAEDPYNNKWWTKAEKPWQALSVCFELAEAYKLEDPTKFVSHLPVHQDGTCNGLQHYAALGGDVEGATQVNMMPRDRPQDVYTFVANLVEERLRVAAAEGNEHAKFLQGKIKRKVVKQTVMTNVYGVTYVGALQQIKKQILQYFDEGEDVAPKLNYLTVLVFASIRELFENAHLIQDWLAEAARRISRSVSIDYSDDNTNGREIHSSSVIWTSPLGLPCVQPYRHKKLIAVKTLVQDISVTTPTGVTSVDSRKQVAGFPPNFIHSLDASHMLMTASACGRHGLHFASVHDSFWTHASDVDTMNTLLRQEFVKLHSRNLVEELKDEFMERYQNTYYFVDIPTNTEAAHKIRTLRKQWALELKRAVKISDELYMERKRLELLNSSNPDEVKAGEEMVTTISLANEYDVESMRAPKKGHNTTPVLSPLKFPDVPKKGDYNVASVEDSLYFFS
ncbi:hypothetical protein LELG_01492 [Lodderomyces elongisporus NRRL YB-4239]|uniref:DNA-directed RNA polymerase n=1 Tax=Lodderomyces elongisporus (strain ATCC 11503 / CBS 2605 / JCM 1781 / NBRC 1676 / NRRL YB-4239) TaxID=379508 RepID=A5DVV6_LODEL|nr:hypothetical protein LELG_01492 [Lodderomyces elongisporus NRRL YB-4239]